MTIHPALRKESRRIGKILFDLGLVGSHSGNMSVRVGRRIFVTRHDAMLGSLGAKDIVEIPLATDTPGKGTRKDAAPSMDLPIHRAIYAVTDAKAIVHAHPVHAVALSLRHHRITPVDVEGKYHFKNVPVVGANTVESYRKMPRLLPPVIRRNKIAVMKGHGSYAIGENLEEALHWTSALEYTATLICLASHLRVRPSRVGAIQRDRPMGGKHTGLPLRLDLDLKRLRERNRRPGG